MRVGDCAFRRQGCRNRDLELFREGDQIGLRLRRHHAAAGDDDGLLRLGEHVHRRAHAGSLCNGTERRDGAIRATRRHMGRSSDHFLSMGVATKAHCFERSW